MVPVSHIVKLRNCCFNIQDIIKKYTEISGSGNKHAALASALGSLTWEKPLHSEFQQLARYLIFILFLCQDPCLTICVSKISYLPGRLGLNIVAALKLNNVNIAFPASYCYYLDLYKAYILWIRRESEYAAWTLVNGYALNHATISTHQLKSHLRDIKSLNQFIEKNGFKLNSEGGILKGLFHDF